MTVRWITPAGNLGILTERNITEIALSATSDYGDVTYRLISGRLPRGLRLADNLIKGSPVEVTKFTQSRFVIRASDNESISDRTFELYVDGADIPIWITREGFLNVGQGDAYFVLDNALVNFQLEASDSDIVAGDTLEFFLMPNGGELPPGLSLSKSGLISGFTDPIFSVEYRPEIVGAYDTGSFDTKPLDVIRNNSNGYDTFFYDDQNFDYNEISRAPRKLSRFYTFAVGITDGENIETRIFKIYVVTEEFLKADNNIVQVDTNLFQADASAFRVPLWITNSELGKYRANNYLTVFLDVYNPPSLPGTITYFLLDRNPDGTDSILPDGMALDSTTGEIAGKVPYQRRITITYKFTILAVNFFEEIAEINYTIRGNWNSLQTYLTNEAVLYDNNLYIARENNTNVIPTEFNVWIPGTSASDKTFTIDIIGEIESSIEWITDENVGVVKPNLPSDIFIEARNLLNPNGGIVYSLVSGVLPPGLIFLPNGLITGKLKQFSDSAGPGLTRFYEIIDGQRDFSVAFDGDDTTFDKIYRFNIRARDSSQASELVKNFYVTAVDDNAKTFGNLYLLALQPKEKRLIWFDFITDSNIFITDDIYRSGDPNFGIQTEVKILLFAGIESTQAVKYVQAMSRNHYRKRVLFGDVKLAKAKDPITQETIYEVIYAEVLDDLEKNRVSISDTVNLPDKINSPVLVSYDAIRVDSDIPLVSDKDHQRIFPNSFDNMRKRVRTVGDRNREFLPLWMRSIQDQATYELGYTKAVVICYAKPGKGRSIVSKIKLRTEFASRGVYSSTIQYQANDSVEYIGEYYTAKIPSFGIIPTNLDNWTKNFNFKSLDFESDRYLIDNIDSVAQDKYLAFPQTGEKLP
jgi:hypothetical protein